MKILPFPHPRRTILLLAALFGSFVVVPTAHAAFIIEVDTDGLDDGVLTYNPNFAFGGDTTTASQSAPTAAVGTTGGDSIFGGNGVLQPDTYLYSYTPGADTDNLALAAGTVLGGGATATGLVGGVSGIYSVYATWPRTENVSGGLTTYSLVDDGGLVPVSIDQNTNLSEWYYLFDVDLTAGNAYTLIQEAGSNSFVSMRSAGVLFDLVEERQQPPGRVPDGGASLALLGIALGPLMSLRGWRARHMR